MRVYLAGPINGRTDADCRDWRNYATRHLADVAEVFDPMIRDYRGRELEPGIAAKIVEQDKRDIDQCDVLLVYFDRPSVGTSMEVLYAWQLGKKVVVINQSDRTLSPWLLYHSHARVDSLDLGVAAVRTLRFAIAEVRNARRP
jgi:nucleoside 2-deoxyribosyltransferase